MTMRVSSVDFSNEFAQTYFTYRERAAQKIYSVVVRTILALLLKIKMLADMGKVFDKYVEHPYPNDRGMVTYF
jgi:hypothetical protein